MKTYTQFIESASEYQIKKQNPNAPDGMVRWAAERSERSESQRNANEATRKATPGGAIQKRTTSSIVKPQSKSGALAKRPSQGITKAKSNKLANPNIKKVDVKVDKPKFQAKRPGTTRTTTTTTTKPETTTTKPETTTTTRPSNTSSEKPKAKERKFGLPQVNKLDTSDEVATGSVRGLNFKNQD